MTPFIMMLEASCTYHRLIACGDQEAADELTNFGTEEGVHKFRGLTALQQAAILLAMAKRMAAHAAWMKRYEEDLQKAEQREAWLERSQNRKPYRQPGVTRGLLHDYETED